MRITPIVILAGSACLSLISAAIAQPRPEPDRAQYMTYREPRSLAAASDVRAAPTDEPPSWMEGNTQKAIEIQDALHGEGR